MSDVAIPSYQSIKDEAYKQLNSIIPDNVKLFNIQKDDQLVESYTLVLFPNNKLVKNISVEIDKLKAVDPHHFYMQNDKMHITLIGEIDSQIKESEVVEACLSTIDKYKISFNINGFASNFYSASILAYPNFKIHNFREEIREKIKLHGTNYGLHLTVYEHMGWINYLRYCAKPKKDLIKAMVDRSDLDFGECVDGKLILLKTRSRTLRDGYIKVVKDFTDLLTFKNKTF